MNKYQKSLDEIQYMCWPFLSDEIQDMQDLVDKATPKEPELEGDGYADGCLVYDTWICPNCDERYEVDYDDYDYCPKCGQALDMSVLREVQDE